MALRRTPPVRDVKSKRAQSRILTGGSFHETKEASWPEWGARWRPGGVYVGVCGCMWARECVAVGGRGCGCTYRMYIRYVWADGGVSMISDDAPKQQQKGRPAGFDWCERGHQGPSSGIHFARPVRGRMHLCPTLNRIGAPWPGGRLGLACEMMAFCRVATGLG